MIFSHASCSWCRGKVHAACMEHLPYTCWLTVSLQAVKDAVKTGRRKDPNHPTSNGGKCQRNHSVPSIIQTTFKGLLTLHSTSKSGPQESRWCHSDAITSKGQLNKRSFTWQRTKYATANYWIFTQAGDFFVYRTWPKFWSRRRINPRPTAVHVLSLSLGTKI